MTEKDEQIALFDWASYRTDLQLLFHIPNEGRRSVQHTQSLLRQGMKPGVPDIFLPIAKGRYHGLFIEMKRKYGGRQTPEQRKWQADLLEQGYCSVVCKGFEDARDVIDWYMRGAK